MRKERLFIYQMELGPIQNFLYFIGDRETKEVALVDPAWDVPYLVREADRLGVKITKIFLTHGHPDHVNGLPEILKRCDVPVFISQNEAPFYKPPCQGLVEVADQEILQVGKVEFRCLRTPGHTPGCLCFFSDGHLISGDTLFVDGCGRCDLPGGDPRQMYQSLYNVIMKLPDETLIYPGHNYGRTPFATIAQQKKTNPYLNCANIEEFLSERMGL